MKSIVLILLVLTPAACFSQSVDNKIVVERLFLEGWNEKNFEGIRDHISDSVYFHYNNQDFHTTFSDLVNLVDMWHNAFQDFRFEILQIVSEDNIVAINLQFSGIHVKEFMGVQPKENEINVSEMMFFRFEEGKLVEAWEVYDQSGMMNQMQGNL